MEADLAAKCRVDDELPPKTPEDQSERQAMWRWGVLGGGIGGLRRVENRGRARSDSGPGLRLWKNGR